MSLDPKVRERFLKLLGIETDAREPQFRQRLQGLDREAASRSMFQSGSHLHNITESHESELEERAALAWGCLTRAYESSASPEVADLAESLKSLLREQINLSAHRMDSSLQSYVERIAPPLHARSQSVDDCRRRLVRKFEAEIDIYADTAATRRASQQEARSHQYNFYGAVGAVQTGANSHSNVVQNLDPVDKTALLEALSLARDAIQTVSELSERQKIELIEIADDCQKELAAPNANNTKLLTMLNVLAATIQTTASARPAYAALKSALLPLGITLP
jgi:hypothetical protein